MQKCCFIVCILYIILNFAYLLLLFITLLLDGVMYDRFNYWFIFCHFVI